MMNHAATAESPKHPSSPSTSESLSLSPMAAGSPIRGTPPSPTAKSSVTPYKVRVFVKPANSFQRAMLLQINECASSYSNFQNGLLIFSQEHRRVCHINAEQKRRCNIKNGFDTLHMLIPHLVQNPNSKVMRAVDFCY